MEKQSLWMLSFLPVLLLVRTTHIIFYLSLLVSLVPLATAVSFDFPSFDRETKLTCFPNQKGICLQGDAFLNEGLQLTKNKLHTSLASSAGRAVYSQPVHIWNSATRQMTDFITQFSFIIHDVDPQIPSGDGLAFFLSSYPSLIPDNSTGGFIGLFPNTSHSDGHASVVAIEFDNYPNGELDSSSADHIGINLNSIRSVVDLAMEGGIKKRILAKVRVEYNANIHRLCVTLSYDDASLEGNYTLSHVVDLREVLPEYVSIGFSAATGSLVQTHTIFSWTFESNLDTRGSGTAKVLVLWAALFVGVTLALLLVWNWRKSNARRREEAIEDALMPSEKMGKKKEYNIVNAEDIKEKREKEDGTGVDTVLRAKSGQGLMVDEDDCLDGMSLEKVGGKSQNQLISSDSETFAKQEEGQNDEGVNLAGTSVEEAGGSQNQVIRSDTEACTNQASGQKDEGVDLDLDGLSLEEAGGSQNQVIGPDSTPFTRQEARQKDEDGSLEEVGGSQNEAISSGSETFSSQGRGQKEENISVDAACLDEDGHGITESEKIKKIVPTSQERGGETNLDEVDTEASVVEEGEGSHIEAPIHMDLLDRWSPKEIPYNVLKDATNNFSEEMMLGKGGFGPVYRGFLSYLGLDVAIKKLSERSEQGMSEYMAEVKIITQLRHRNLVKLVGWCHERGELMLVYELMPNGSLDNYLFKDNNLLEWSVRYKIALGLANALMYLHEECDPYVLHRDIKSSNVLLDSKLDAKLADFGLARLFNLDISTLRVTHPAGTRGYWAPEYALMSQASRRSDVYSYGVVALEIACGRKAIFLAQQEDVESSRALLVEWVWDLYGKGTILDAADKRLNGNFDRAEMERMLMVGLWCAHPDHRQRPSIRLAGNALLYPEATPLPALPDRTPPWAFPLDLMQMQVAQSSPMPLASPTSTSSDTSDDPMSSTAQLERSGDKVLHTSPGPALLRKPKRPLIARFTGWLKWKKATIDDEALADEIRMWSWPKEFSYNELIQATDNFSSKLGEGAFGSVYRGQLVSGLNVVVKRFGSSHPQFFYTAAVSTLGRLAHRNLVQLVGWCLGHGEQLLVYEYMANGTLDRHLFGSSTIPWEGRYKAVFSLASALCFLHNGLEHRLFHRGIKPSHLYFDKEFNMKLGGFALAKLELQDSELSVCIVGTYGYRAPEYCKSGRYTTASDVYSFGVVTLEVACGKRYLNSTQDYDFLGQWVWRLYANGNLLEASDERLMGNFDSREMERLMVVGLWCTHDDPAQRPPMETVVRVLQFVEDPPALQLQVPPDGLNSTTGGRQEFVL